MALLYTQFSFAQNKERVQIDFGSGYQQENFHWSIAGNLQGQNPNVYSELKWKDLKGTVLSTHLNANIWSDLFISGGYSRSNIHSGKVNDTDYGSDNRTNPVYNQNFDDNKGYSDMWHAGLVWHFLKGNIVTIRPELGYAQSRQDLYLVDLSGQFANLNSSYATKWKGPYVKLSAIWHIIPKLNLNADVQYTQASYQADADWNLITQFQHPVSYTHSADGFGINTNATLTYSITHLIGIYIGGGYFNWQTGNGTDRLYLTNGQTNDTQMNGAFSNGYKLVAGLSLKY
ncbi:hypothetical protein [Mucilaginibacter jinjuensis]|uniref:Protochlamydia outer membrane protein domain-containing protein n=1 Tax=Mucilaginibacter jinjuensis TaxID=1176721 RepID=A0ABY7T9M0_9SPHI|nr:hypothetical protein [Mucilaginibacter jinjuensis]WCT13184.1 hypothetical protein PQO05_04455 [Mucilaginibacter jinjuensis]